MNTDMHSIWELHQEVQVHFRESGNKRGDCRSISTGCKGGAIG